MGRSDISITLDGDFYRSPAGDPIFPPGQVISGQVHLSVHDHKKIDAVEIRFEGMVHTRTTRSNGNTTSTYNEKIELFTFSQRVFQGPYKMQSTALSWPFTFTLPEYTQYHRHGHVAEDPNFESTPHALPPTLYVSEGTRLKINIWYKMCAVINPDNLLGGKKSEMPVVVSPYASSPNPLPIPVLYRFQDQQYKSSSLRPHRLSFRDKMKHAFGDDPALKTPSVNFRPTAYFPTSASVWQPMSLSMSLHHYTTGQNDPEHPTLILERVVVTVKQYVMQRVKHLVTNFNNDKSFEIARYTLNPKLALSLDNTAVEIASEFRIADMQMLSNVIVPTFKTYTANQSYKLKVEATVLHVESQHRFNFEVKEPFVILPTDRPEQTVISPPLEPPAVVDSPLSSAKVDVKSSLNEKPAYGFEGIAPPAYDGPSSSTV